MDDTRPKRPARRAMQDTLADSEDSRSLVERCGGNIAVAHLPNILSRWYFQRGYDWVRVRHCCCNVACTAIY